MPALAAVSLWQQPRAYATYWDSYNDRPAAPRGGFSLGRDTSDTTSPLRSYRNAPPLDEKRPGPRVNVKLARPPRDDEIRQSHVYLEEEVQDILEEERIAEEERKAEEARRAEEERRAEEAREAALENGEDVQLPEPEMRPPPRQPPVPPAPRALKDVLAGLDRKTESLQVVGMPDSNGRSWLRWPVCRIVNKKDEYVKQQQEKEQQKKLKAASKVKELEINWALAPHDLEHKMKSLRGFLAKGLKVQVLLMKKQGAKVRATKEDAERVIQKIEEATAEVKGSSEYKKRDGSLLGTMKISLQGKLQ